VSVARQLGSFQLLAPIASGGMADIHLARQVGAAFQRLVVVKLLHPHLARDPEIVQLFLREARLAARIGHANVVQIFDAGDAGDGFYIAMEHVVGVSVSALLRRAGELGEPVPPEVVGELCAQISAGLHAAHELCDESGRPLRIVHRDVSPQNLMVTVDGVVKLLDFGVATAVEGDAITRSGQLRGKIAYLSPEQCRGEELDRRSDLFALGIVLYELATGARLFRRATDHLTFQAILEDPIPDARSVRPTLPEPIARLIALALRRPRDERIATAAELEQMARIALTELGVATSPATLARFLGDRHRADLDEKQRLVRQAIAGVAAPPRADAQTVTVAGEQLRGERTRASRGSRRWFLAASVGTLTLATGGVSVWLWRRPSGQPIRLGVVPIYPARPASHDLDPLARYLEGELRVPIKVWVARDYTALGVALERGELSVAVLPPLEYVITRRRVPALQVLVAQHYERARTYQGLLVVKADSPLVEVGQLRGKRLCYVDPHSTSGFLLPRHFLRQRGVDPDRDVQGHRFSRRHTAVMEDVLAGRCDAGAIYSLALLNARDFGIRSSALRTLAITGHVPFGVVCASASLAAERAAALRDALLRLEPRKHLARETVGSIYRISGFVEARPEEFAPIEAAARAEHLL
jgi:phosphate/phosphite/phosphonate ABC transporter binding protein